MGTYRDMFWAPTSMAVKNPTFLLLKAPTRFFIALHIGI